MGSRCGECGGQLNESSSCEDCGTQHGPGDPVGALLAAARYVLSAEDAGWPGHSPLVHLREAVEAFDGD